MMYMYLPLSPGGHSGMERKLITCPIEIAALQDLKHITGRRESGFTNVVAHPVINFLSNFDRYED